MGIKKSVIEIVNEKIITKLESGVNPWRKTWVTSGGIKLRVPANYISNKAYSGINFALLEPGYYLTFKQCQELGGTIKKGAKGEMVIFSKPIENKQEKDEEDFITLNKPSFVLRYYYVFRLEDCEGIKELKKRPPIEKHEYFETLSNEEIENLIKNYTDREHLKIENIEQSRAFYSPSTDSITLPLTKQFENISEYYATAFHELGHSTGHPTRLNREGITNINFFGSDRYSKEELIAEITSAYCMNYCNIETDETIANSVAYLKGWAEKLKGNTANYFIMNATTQAEKAYKLILNIN